MDTYQEMQLAAIDAAKAGDFIQSLALFDQVLRVQPQLYQTWCNRGNVLDDLGRAEEAVASYDRALHIYPDYETARLNRGVVQQKMANAAFNQGVVLDNNKELAAALVCYERALALNPSHCEANLNAALVLKDLGRFEEAAMRLMASETLEAGFVHGLNQAADIWGVQLGRHDEALACYQRSLAIDPDQPHIRLSSGESLLATGQLAAGWAALELRATHGGPFMGWIGFPQPQWQGEPLAGKRILLWCEQGYGDTFQFIRYVCQVRQLGADVYVLAPETLRRILVSSFAPAGIKFVRGSAQASPFDFHCPLMSLPLALGIDRVEHIPVATPYILASQSAQDKWKERLSRDAAVDAMRLGLVWASSHRPELPPERDLRALRFSQLAPLMRAAHTLGAQIFSLQLDEPSSQLTNWMAANGNALPIIDCAPDLNDWEDTAALIANLDLVICCDTAVAHLAAAMGKPTWILLHHSPCWRWLQGRSDSPWYPSVRLFKQARAGDWADVVDRVAQTFILNYKVFGGKGPERAQAMQLVAIEAAKAGDLTQSLALLDQVLEVQPDLYQAWCNRGNVLDDLGRANEALASYDRALQIHPDYETAMRNREIVAKKMANAVFDQGVLLDNAKELESALACYEQALMLDQKHTAANLNAALVLEELGRVDEAIVRFKASGEIDPSYVEGLNRAGDILGTELGRHQEALDCYDASLTQKPEQVHLLWNRSHSELALGRYKQGWLNYDTRTPNAEDTTGWIDFPQPRWRGEPLAGKRILLWCEQGFGDVFQFCRYVLLVRDRGATVFLLVHPTIERLFQIVFAGEGIQIILGSALAKPFDYQCPLLALPLACNTDSVDDIPSPAPYLWPDTKDAQQWQQRMAEDFGTRKRRIGLVWASGHRPESPHWHAMNMRSLHLSQLAPLATVQNASSMQMFSLQLEAPAQQLAELQSQYWRGPEIIDLTAGLKDWADTAARIANLDLVISTDTALAHLAAAMGKPTWILLHHSPCWRWLDNRDDSPWYPSVRLFRQTKAGDWDEVVNRVVVALHALPP